MMKRWIFSTVLFFITWSALALPARPGVYTYTQPDGSVVKLELHGDEFLSWRTLAGTRQVVQLDADGYWKPASLSPSRQRQAEESRRRARRRSMGTVSNFSRTHGVHHVPVLLVEFSDVKFSLDDLMGRFSRLLNGEQYTDDGATGSVSQYFRDQSRGAYQPVFDLYGPVTLPHPMAYYGAPRTADGLNDSRPEEALYHAFLALDDTVDFSGYDEDHDGLMDMVLFFHAGYNEAEHGPADAIWSHQNTCQNSRSKEVIEATFDGLRLDTYFCTSELRGSSGTRICGIGATAHEFSHSLGLPDFYDSDYYENGLCAGPAHYSLMAEGCYNNESRTPPSFNAVERILLGWMQEDEMTLLKDGKHSLASVRENITAKSITAVEGEYFLYECRDGKGWDAYLPEGFLVYHVDQSTIRRVGLLTPRERWDYWNLYQYNAINAYGNHPCFYIVPAADQGNLDCYKPREDWIFPGTSGITTFEPVDWEGKKTGAVFSDISYADGKVSFTLRGEGNPPLPDTFGKTGIPAILDPGHGKYRVADEFVLRLDTPEGSVPASIQWSYDETAASEKVTLTAGHHTVKAVIKWVDGSVETLELLIHVQ